MAEPLSVVIVHWNRADRCRQAIEAVLALDVPARAIVVDNGSRPDQLAALHQAARSFGPRVTVLEAGANLGFGPAANVGYRHWLQHGAGDWVALMPHDALPAPDCLGRMLDAVESRPRAGLACADFGDGMTPIVDPYFGGILAPASVAEGWEPAGHPHGTFMLARRACLEDVGLFDERYFAYCEEADLALRARDHGWEIGLVRGARVANPDVGSTVAAVDYLQLRNTLLLVREHSGRYHAFIRFCIALWHLGVGLVSPPRRGPYWNVPARLQALRDHVLQHYGPPPPALLVRQL